MADSSTMTRRAGGPNASAYRASPLTFGVIIAGMRASDVLHLALRVLAGSEVRRLR